MELLFAWIKKERNIENCGFNFGGKYLFAYNSEKKELDIRKNNAFVNGFFDLKFDYENSRNQEPPRVSNITGVVGRNGTGKSSLLEFLTDMPYYLNHNMDFSNYSGTSKVSEFNFDDPPKNSSFLVFKVKNETGDKLHILSEKVENREPIPIAKKQITSIIISDDINGGMDSEKTKTFKFSVGTGLSINKDSVKVETIDILNKEYYQSVIYFSNSFYDRITDELVSSNLKNLGFRQSLMKLAEKGGSFAEVTKQHKNKEMKQVISMVSDINQNTTDDKSDFRDPVKLPNYVILSVQDFLRRFEQKDRLSFTKSDKDKESQQAIATITSFFQNYSFLDMSQTNNPNYKFLVDFCNAAFLYYADNRFLNAYKIVDAIQNQYNKIVVDKQQGFLNNILSNEKYYYEHKKDKVEKNKVETKALFDSFIILIEDKNVTFNENNESLSIQILNKQTKDVYENFVEKYFKSISLLPHFDGFLEFSLSHLGGDEASPLSAGESALYYTFGRFHSLKHKVLNNNLLILIDEGDLYLHPEWQKSYIDYLVKFLPVIFKDKQIQIVITSHSPIILSDLPKENVIFLTKGFNKKCKVLPTEGRKTFGANIHDLYNDGFFVDGNNSTGAMGKFAENKINKVIDWLNSDKEKDSDRLKDIFDYNKNIIELVDEPILYNRLYEMYSEKLVEEFGEMLGEEELNSLYEKRKKTLEEEHQKRIQKLRKDRK